MTTRGGATGGDASPAREASRGRGRFITLEGPEGGGKTHQAAALRDRLRAADIPVLLTREPGGSAIGERIRTLLLEVDQTHEALAPWTDALLFTAARAQLVREVIRPALRQRKTVLCARFADSTLAYQGFGSGLSVDELGRLQDLATDGLTPDLTLLLDLPAEMGLRRKSGQEETRFEAGFDLDFHRRVRDGFLTLAAREPSRFAVIDATNGPDDVLAAILAAVAERLPELRRVASRSTVLSDTRSEPELGSVRSTR